MADEAADDPTIAPDCTGERYGGGGYLIRRDAEMLEVDDPEPLQPKDVVYRRYEPGDERDQRWQTLMAKSGGRASENWDPEPAVVTDREPKVIPGTEPRRPGDPEVWDRPRQITYRQGAHLVRRGDVALSVSDSEVMLPGDVIVHRDEPWGEKG